MTTTIPVFDPGQRVPCQQHPHLFEGPSRLDITLTVEQQRAVDLCHTCPARRECLIFALQHNTNSPHVNNNINDGVLGGMTGPQRRHLLRTGEIASPPPPPPIIPTHRSGRPCPRNHPPHEFTSQKSRGGRRCKACDRMRARQRRLKELMIA